MAQRAGGPVRLLLAGLILVLAVAGLVAQAGFMLREGSDQLSAPTTHPLRDLLTEADRTIPPGQRYAIPSDVRADNARYFLYPRQRVAVAAFDRDTGESLVLAGSVRSRIGPAPASHQSQVSTPNPTGIPASTATRVSPSVAAWRGSRWKDDNNTRHATRLRRNRSGLQALSSRPRAAAAAR